MNNNILLAILAAAAAIPLASAQNVRHLSVSDFETGRDGSRFFVNMNVDPAKLDQRTNRRVELFPVIYSADSTHRVALPSLTVAGRNMYYSTLRNVDTAQPTSLYRSGRGPVVNYSHSVPYEDWMEVCTVGVEARNTGCCGEPQGNELVPVSDLDLRPRRFQPHFAYVAPVDTATKRFNLSGRANVRFIVNKTNIDWKYANNYVELDSILRTVNAVKDNPDATVDSIFLKGFASPEGPYDNNVRLAKGRTEVIKEYVRKNSTFPASVYHTASVPADWAGLRAWLVTSSLADKDAMIAFIDDSSIPAPVRNDEFRRRFPKDYPFILDNVYPPLRHTEYRITYTVRKYLNVDEIREVMRTRPYNLSQNELFLLANSYKAGSPEYDEVFEVAVRLFPDNTTANLNAANTAMHRGDYAAARRYLDRAGDAPEAVYGRGVLLALEGNYSEALPLLRKAQQLGVAEAAEAVGQAEMCQAGPNGITYYDVD